MQTCCPVTNPPSWPQSLVSCVARRHRRSSHHTTVTVKFIGRPSPPTKLKVNGEEPEGEILLYNSSRQIVGEEANGESTAAFIVCVVALFFCLSCVLALTPQLDVHRRAQVEHCV